MGAAVLGAAFSIGKSLFKKKAKKVVSRAVTKVAAMTGSAGDFQQSAGASTSALYNLGANLGNAVAGYMGGGLPNVAPANFGSPIPFPPTPPSGGGSILTGIVNDVGSIVKYATGGTAIQRHPGAVALPDGTIWYKGHLYVYRQTASGGRMQRVTRDRRTGAIIPAPKQMNVLNPHALHRSMRRVEGFHRVASSALKHMEKWARKTQHRRAPAHAPKKRK